MPAEQACSEQALQSIPDSQHWGVIAIDKQHRVTAANARAASLLQRVIPLGLPIQQLLTTELPSNDGSLTELLESGFEFEVGSTWVWIKSSPVSDGNPIQTTLTVIDITSLHRSLDERMASLRFLSHDLRSPQNSIVALTQLHESDPAAFEACGGMARIAELARYALSLGEDFIFSSVVGGLRQRDFSRFDVRATIREMIPQLEVAAVYRGVSLQLWLPDGSAVWLNGLRAFVARAFQNLVDNAIQASRQGQVVAVSLKICDECVDILIKDWAGGLPGIHQQGRIDEFDGFSKNTSKGFGLGLKLAAQIVKLHGGMLYAESNQGLGTSLTMRLPRITGARAATSQQPSARDFGALEPRAPI